MGVLSESHGTLDFGLGFLIQLPQKKMQVAEGRTGDLQKDDSGTPAGDLTEIRRQPIKGKSPDGLHRVTRGSPTIVPSEIAGSPFRRINISCDFQLQERDLWDVMKTTMG